MHLIQKILIANRGEIALRIMRTCTQMGIATVAVYSDADENALFVKYADEAVCIGGRNASESYLDQHKILEAAKLTGADAIHPGYGFLSENTGFAQRCADEGLIFIGPNPTAIEAMGSKIGAKNIMQQRGVPTIPGYNGERQDADTLTAEALHIGFPVLLKASAGGGGKGMRIVRAAADLAKSIEAAKREALSAFGDDTLLIEKYFDSARHIEFQIFGDKHGNAIHCFERECSIQRRYQKIIEETPSPALTPALRQTMGHAAVEAAKAIGYDNAGTVEFILTPEGDFYFLEVNTRLQVEHPVTEMVTGLDLVQLQIEVAQGLPLPVRQKDLQQKGHAIECRLYAEDSANNFLPTTGTIHLWQPGKTGGMRYDTGVESGSVIDIYYDPMIAKVIAYAPNRFDCIRQMRRALQELAVLGLTTNKDFLIQILGNSHFIEGRFDTHFIGNHFTYNAQHLTEYAVQHFAVAALLWEWQQRNRKRTLLSQLPSGWRNNFYQNQTAVFRWGSTEIECAYHAKSNTALDVYIAGNYFDATLNSAEPHALVCTINRHRFCFSVADTPAVLHLQWPDWGSIALQKVSPFPEKEKETIKGAYAAPMPGEVVMVLVKPGDAVKTGDTLLVLSSMKMENAIEATENGTVAEVFVQEKSFVEADALLLKMEG
ncbi:acetyl-CoA carboxylase biotin carboxylase subunit [Sphingobacteriales bacterium UPWRP_1]|nr:hypothetical protein BVG80_01870 [Sphingobacteriales bacterium TSM_CSM]PSJ75107.1 acetyl-CoA carboxylase biotin carboxylase subunit [Sphingobacteriales bacterium UPWRP_1]